MKIICEFPEEKNPCRDIVEGRRKLATVQCVPVRVVTLARSNSEPLPPLHHQATDKVQRHGKTGMSAGEAIEIFLAQVQGNFTSEEAAEYMARIGWDGGPLALNRASIWLRKLADLGRVAGFRPAGEKFIMWSKL